MSIVARENYRRKSGTWAIAVLCEDCPSADAAPGDAAALVMPWFASS